MATDHARSPPRSAPAKATERYPTEAGAAAFELTLRVLRHGTQLSVLQLPGQVPRLLDDPCPARAIGAAGEVDATAADLDPEEHIELGQPDRIHHEEVNCQDLIGVLANEFAPAALAAARRWRYAVATEHSADGQVGAAVAELEELALNAAITPP